MPSICDELAKSIVTVGRGNGGWKVYVFSDLFSWQPTEEGAELMASHVRTPLIEALTRAYNAGVTEGEAHAREKLVSEIATELRAPHTTKETK